MDKVVHFEIPFEDNKRAVKFYKETFNWKIQQYGEMKYWGVCTVEIDEKHMPLEKGAINGGMLKRPEFMKGPVITINVKNIDKAIEKVKENGGKIVHEKLKVGDVGYTAYFKDTEGNVLGLWQEIFK